MTGQNEWELDRTEGGFITDYIGTITDSYFATDPKYNEGNTLQLCWKTTVDNLDELAEERDMDPETTEGIRANGFTQKYSCGPKWVTEDGGQTAEHPRGPSKMFHATSQVGRIIDSALGSLEHYGDAAKDVEGNQVKVTLDGLFDVLKERGNPKQANIWLGLKFRFQEVAFDYGKGRNGEPMVSKRAMPVEFLGVESAGGIKSDTTATTATTADDKAAKAAAAKKKAAAKKAAASNGAGALDGKLTELGVSDDIKAQIIEALSAASDANEFSDLAIEIDGVTENDALMEAVVDEGSDGLFALKS